jgi:hypothetical protein
MTAEEEKRYLWMIAAAGALAVAILTFCGWAAFVLSPH